MEKTRTIYPYILCIPGESGGGVGWGVMIRYLKFCYYDNLYLRQTKSSLISGVVLTLAMLNKLKCHTQFLFSANQITFFFFRLLDPGSWYTYLMTNSDDLDQLALQTVYLDLHCLRRQGISMFSRTNMLIWNINPCPAEPGYTLPLQTV